VLNHIENIKGLVTKTGLVKSLRKYYADNIEAVTYHYSVYDTIPTSFICIANSCEGDYVPFMQKFKEIQKGYYSKERLPAKHCRENVWLIKPAALNQGKGIEFFKDDLNGMKNFLNSKPALTHWVFQKYIEKPLLYRGRKFDFRVWALITHKLDLYIYRSGYIRTSSDKYTLDSNYNYVHLTNNCLQKYGDKYGVYEDGNTLSFEAFESYLKHEYGNFSIDFDKTVFTRMKDLMIDSFLAVKHELNPTKRKNCFELLGFDFMLDEDLRLWLIEVNSNPYLGVPNKFIEGLLPKMLNDLMEKVLDPYFKPANNLPKKDIGNGFELIYSDHKKVNQRRGFSVGIYPIPELAQKINVSSMNIHKEIHTEVTKHLEIENLAIKQLIQLKTSLPMYEKNAVILKTKKIKHKKSIPKKEDSSHPYFTDSLKRSIGTSYLSTKQKKFI